MEAELFIQPDGKVVVVYDDETAPCFIELGAITNKRACYVEPMNDGWAIYAHPILLAYPPLSETKNASGVIGVFPTRAKALEIEKKWLELYLTTRHLYVWDNEQQKFV